MARQPRKRAAKSPAAEASANGRKQPPPDPHQPSAPSWVAVPASELTAAPLEYLWEPWIPLGALTLVVGPSEAGKSTFLAALAADAVGGTRIGAKKKRTPGTALLLPGEEPVGMLRKRLEAAAGKLASRCQVLRPGESRPGDSRLTLPSALGELRAVIRQARPRLVTFDPADSYMDPSLSEDRNADVRRFLEPLQQLAEEEGCAIVAVHHPGKQEDNAILGSVAWRNVPRAILRLTPGADEGEFLLIHFKSSSGEHAPAILFSLEKHGKAVVWKPHGTADRSLDALCAPDASIPAMRDAVKDCCRLLHALLRDGPLEVPEVWNRCRSEAMSEASFRRAKKVLALTTRRVGFGPGSKCYLHPPVKWPEWM